MSKKPKTLQEALAYFSDYAKCMEYLIDCRWPSGPVCPTCGSLRVSYNVKRRIWQCSAHHAKRQFSVKVGTIFEDSPIALDKWLGAAWMIANANRGVSSYEISRVLGVTQKTAWFMLHRIRIALADEPGETAEHDNGQSGEILMAAAAA